MTSRSPSVLILQCRHAIIAPHLEYHPRHDMSKMS